MASAITDAIILPPKILGRHSCSECHKYLSVGPVVVTRGGRTICGRCNTSSLYDQVAESCLFPCVNYNAGCQELLPYNEAKDHEASCSKKATISCPFCSYAGDELQLVQHFKEEHSEYVVDDIFELIPEDGYSRNLIFLKDEHVLCVTVITRGKCFEIYNALLTPSFSEFKRFTLCFFEFDDDNHFITFRIRITHNSNDFPVDIDTDYKEEVGDENCVQLEKCFLVAHDYLANCLGTGSYYCRMNYVDDKDQGLEMAKQKLKGNNKKEKLVISKPGPPKVCSEKNHLNNVDHVLKMDTAVLRQLAKDCLVEAPKCSRCEKYIIHRNGNFMCPKEHIVCKSCEGMKCPECEDFVQWNYQYKYHDILLNCEWGCKENINIFEYRNHIRFCKARLYNCPDKNCQYVGVLDDFKKHWHLNELKCSDMITLTWKEKNLYWLLPRHQELVYVTFQITSDDQGLVTIHEDDVLFPEFYRCEMTKCTVEQDWVSLKNGIGRCQKIKNQTENYYFYLYMKST